MDAYVKVIRKSSASDRDSIHECGWPSTSPTASTSRIGHRVIAPIKRKVEEVDGHGPSLLLKASARSSRAAAARDTAMILKTLKDASNPITHSDLRERSDHVTSVSTGHERREDKQSRKAIHFESRRRQVHEQQEARRQVGTTDVLKGVRAYLAFCDFDTDIELRRKIAEAGGAVTFNETSATHIVTSQWLSGSKTHKSFTTRKRNKIHVVNPTWITDSIEKGKRQTEWKYRQVEDETQSRTMDRYFISKS